jgi:GDP-L-fucose synthase
MKMRIGIFQRNPWHTEIIGPFYYMLKELGHTCIVYNDGLDKVDYLPFYKTLFPDMLIKNCHEVYRDIPILDYVILLTLEDSINNEFVKAYVDKFIFMTHLKQEVDKTKRVYGNSTKRITLTPLVKDSNYILPLYVTYNPNENERPLSNERKTLAIIGWCDKENKDFEDIQFFLENNRDKKVVIFSKQTGKIQDLEELKEKNENVHIILNCDTPRMIAILKNVDYIWIPVNPNKETSVHIKDRSTGALPLSYNLGVPLIVPKVFNDIYELEGNIVYEKSIREIIFDTVFDIERLKKFKRKTISKNLQILKELLVYRPKCLVTGGCGFVGRYFSEQLMKTYNVTIVDNMESTSAKEPGYMYIKQDITDFLKEDTTDFLKEDTTDFLKEDTDDTFDLVVHLAAVVGGRHVIENEPFQVSKDLIIDAVFFDWVAKRKPKKVIYFSSSAVYPIEYQTENNPKKLREDMVDFREGNIGVPDLTYGWAKLTGEFLARIAHTKYGTDIVCYRPFSGYGEAQHETYPFPSIISRACRREDPLVVWSNSVRDFVHIEDIYNFVMDTYNSVHDGSALNIGSGVATSFVELAKIAAKEVGYEPEIKVLNDKPKGVYYRVSDNGTTKRSDTTTEGSDTTTKRSDGVSDTTTNRSDKFKVSLEEGVRRMVRAKSRYIFSVKMGDLSLDIKQLIGKSLN